MKEWFISIYMVTSIHLNKNRNIKSVIRFEYLLKYKRQLFDKGYTPNWTEEIFIIDKIKYTNPITYQLKDLKNEKI